MRIHTEIYICIDCLYLLSYGDADNPDRPNEDIMRDVTERWGELTRHIHRTLAVETFSHSPCGACGSEIAGQRYSAVILCNHEECAV